jgi:YidC/Oxa1 family membrane protein insertase
MAGSSKSVDWVKIVGILAAIGIFMGTQYWVGQRRKARMEKARREAALNPKPKPDPGKRAGDGGEAPEPARGKPESIQAPQDPTDDKTARAKADVERPDEPKKEPEKEPKDEEPKKGKEPEKKAPTEPKDIPDIVVEGRHLNVTFSARGAALKGAVLADQKLSARSKNKGLEILNEIEPGKWTLSLMDFRFDGKKFEDLESRVWKLERNSQGYVGEHGDWTIAYSTVLGDHRGKEWFPLCKVTKTFRIFEESRHIDCDIEVQNRTERPAGYDYSLRGPAGILLDGPPDNPEQGAYVEIKCTLAGRGKDEDEPEISFVYAKNAGDEDETGRRISYAENLWAAVKNRFFMAALIAREPDQVNKVIVHPLNQDDRNRRADKDDDQRYQRQNVCPVFYRLERNKQEGTELAAGATAEPDSFALYIGPARESLVQAYEKELGFKKPVHLHLSVQYADIFGWRWPRIDWLASKLLVVFNLINSIIGSYGIAVIILTLLVKLCLHPLQRKMSISMHKMQELQPKLKAIDDKYAGQNKPEIRQKKEMEKLDLMRKEGANPAVGCLPVFLQMPIFFALYGTFRYAFEIRQARFLWIEDMALSDRLFEFGFWPYELNLLPLIYMAMTWFQMKRQPKPASSDPQQEMNRKMMQYMPILFGFIFYKMPAGLVLYFAASACFGFMETSYIKRFVLKVDKFGKPLPATS